MEAALRARVLASAPITALVGSRVYWVDRPQASALPAITLTNVFDERARHLKGFQPRQFALIQCDIWSEVYSMGKAIKEAVIVALDEPETINGVNFGAITDVSAVDRSERVGTATIHNSQVSFRVNYAAAN